MVTLKETPQVAEHQVDIAEMNQRLAVQVEEILEEAKDTAAGKKPESLGWHYRVPAAGVRYYGF